MFPTLFSIKIGKFKEDYSIKLKSDVSPFTVSSLRRVPIPLYNNTYLKKET